MLVLKGFFLKLAKHKQYFKLVFKNIFPGSHRIHVETESKGRRMGICIFFFKRMLSNILRYFWESQSQIMT